MNVRGRSVRSFGLGFESSVGETVPVFVRCLIGIQVAVELYMYRSAFYVAVGMNICGTRVTFIRERMF